MSKKIRNHDRIDDSSNEFKQVTVYDRLGEAAVASQLELVRQALKRIPSTTIVGADQEVIAGQVTNVLGEQGAMIATYAQRVIEDPKFKRNTTMSSDQLASSVASMIEDLLRRTPHTEEDNGSQRQEISPKKEGNDYLKTEPLSPDSFLVQIQELEEQLLSNAPIQAADAIRQEISSFRQTVAGLSSPILPHVERTIKRNIAKLERKFSKKDNKKKGKGGRRYDEDEM